METLRALIVEDSADDAALLTLALEQAGFAAQCGQVDNAMDFQEALTTQAWDIIFSDHSMPSFSSLDALKILKESQKDIPLIVISGAMGERLAVDAMKAGASDYFTKGELALLGPAILRERHQAKIRAERRLLEAKVRESEARFRAMADATPMMIWTVDPEGQLTYYNKALLDFTGLTDEEVYTKGWPFSIHPDDLPVVSDLLQQAMKKRIRFEAEFRTRRYDGDYFWLVSVGEPRYMPDGDFVGYVGSGFNVHDRRLAEEALKASEERLAKALSWEHTTRRVIQDLYRIEDSHDLLQELATQIGTIMHVSRCFVMELVDGVPQAISIEYRRSDAVKSVMGYVPDKEDCPLLAQCADKTMVLIPNTQTETEKLNAHWREVYRQYEVHSLVALPIVTENNTLRHIIVLHSDTPRVWEDSETAFLHIIAEQAADSIAQSLANETIQEANRRKSQFLATMSHELRTPLNAIIGYSEMLRDGLGGDLDARQQKYANNISASGHHLLTLVNDILDVSKIEAGKLSLKLEPVDPRPILSEVETLCLEACVRNDVRLNMDISSDTTTVLADPLRLKQILVNLAGNAIKFNRPNGEVTMRVFPEADYVVFQVEDTGIGISPKNMEALFTEFYQVDNSYAREHQGTGLGLNLSKRLAEMHGGNISVHSEEGVGSVFSVRFPQR